MSNPNPRSSSPIDLALTTSPLLHPDYQYWAPIWRNIRDAEIGEVEIKRNSTKYLPKLQGHDAAQYASYLSRAVFFNMTAKTLGALYGTMYRRNPKVSGLTPALLKLTKRFSKEGMSLHLTSKTAAKEVIAVGRYGMLVDSSPDGVGSAYVACYTTENILDWNMDEVNGTQVLTRVVLRELTYQRKNHLTAYSYSSRFRILVLNDLDGDPIYEQHVYEDRDLNGVPDYNALPDEIIIPTVRGETLSYIPFSVVGPFTNHPDIQKPPILDIVTLNLSHYQSYAQLEQGRFFTANPVYWTAGSEVGDEAGEYYVGPDVVWELGKGGTAGVIEFTGQGLKSLESALDQKEAQIAAIGGRMMPGASRGAAESDNALKMKEQNEQTMLMNISDTLDEAFSQVLAWWADWNNASTGVVANINFEMNRDFLMKDIGAREFRAIHQMYAAGLIPITVLYEYLRKAEVIPDWMDESEFMRLVDDAKQFPHMVDVIAQMNNYPDAASFFKYKAEKEMLQMTLDSQEIVASESEPNAPPIPKQTTALHTAENNKRWGN